MNYDKLMQEEINNLKQRPKLLVHSCCGPCSSYVLLTLMKHFDISVLFYNPNIEPKEEYELRKLNQKKLIKIYNVNFIESDYDNDSYRNLIKGLEAEPEGSKRCYKCIEHRLNKTAEVAKLNKYDYFTTTLSVSPHKNAKLINQLGQEISKKYNIKFLVADFKKRNGYKESIMLSQKYKLYRQEYCGCLFSKTFDK